MKRHYYKAAFLCVRVHGDHCNIITLVKLLLPSNVKIKREAEAAFFTVPSSATDELTTRIGRGTVRTFFYKLDN
jgi:hypothetical protein